MKYAREQTQSGRSRRPFKGHGGEPVDSCFLSACSVSPAFNAWITTRLDSDSSLVGTLLGFTFVEPQDLHDIHAQVSILMTQYGVNFPELPDFDFSRVEAEWQRLRSSIPEVWKFNNDGREFQVGESIKARGLDAEYPVVLIPGIISTVRCVLHLLLQHKVLSLNTGVGILVYITRLPCILPREALGRVQYDLSSDI